MSTMRLHNKKVKLNVDKILNDPKRTNKLFIDFVNNHKNDVLIAIKDKKAQYLYTFKENEVWLFDESDLILVK